MYQLGNWQLRWLGHDSFQLRNQTTTIYLDPYQIPAGKPADYICITHDHYDHFDPASIQTLRKINTAIFGPETVTSQLDEMATPLLPGDRQETKDLIIEAVASYNRDKQYHPKTDKTLGYILTINGQRIYHAGDTDLIPEMAELGPIDVALLPVSGTYTMTAEEAAKAVEIIKPKIAIPMHYGTIIGSQADAQEFASLVGKAATVAILEKESAE